ncbi:SDR family oxidoreductase [Azospirillum thermophilum]|uniref:Short-chain dehydrogenase n=1 Tax=Azospirillum thermophilum TaxID=2202148 RepID=A0A2S2CS14_9PROT|nr:SDR family oxidoreductase [Azospirillum thermophilum]AWK87259.1 short-chain dehydrogenase [Azospirillum thermophilum]
MRLTLKPIDAQTIVITGATSGIGLATARMAAQRGARLVLTARDRDALGRLCEEIRADGGDAVHCVADVADPAALKQVADLAVRTHGGIDCWVNNAGVSIYGRIEETPVEDHRRLFETDYWGVVNGSIAALPHLRRNGGALINVGSALSDRAIPLQGPYSAAKHAVKGFTDALRMELEADDAHISVTLIKPAAIDTLYEEHARNLLESEPLNPAPVYAPELVAKAILHAAEHPVRDLYVGSAAKLFSLSETFMPRLTDYAMERTLTRWQRAGGPKRQRGDALYGPAGDGRTRAGRHRFVRETSLYTEAQMHPWISAALVAGFGVLAGAAIARGWVRSGEPRHTWHEPHPDRAVERRRGDADLGYGRRTLGHNAKPAWLATSEREVTFRE